MPSLCGLVLLRLERLLPPRRDALFRLVRHLKQKHSLRLNPVSGHLLPRAIITPSGVGRDNYLAKWSVSSPMALGETLTFAVQRLNYIISIIEHVVRRLIIAKQGHLYTNVKSEGATA